MTSPCPFCSPEAARVFHAGDLILGLWDKYPVSPGHALLVPKRHVASWFEATAAERSELQEGVDVARRAIQQNYSPNGYNIGINVGTEAGQTVFHLHVHVIPRYVGDVDDPRGGVRGVVPARRLPGRGEPAHEIVAPSCLSDVESSATYLSPLTGLPHGRAIVTGGLDDPLINHLRAHLDQAVRADIAVAFVLESGLSEIREYLADMLFKGGSLRLVTGDYLGATEPSALLRLLDLQDRYPHQVELRVFEAGRGSFHPKSYIVQNAHRVVTAYVGSSNLTRTALTTGVEWNYRPFSTTDPQGVADVQAAFEHLFVTPQAKRLDAAWVDSYRLRRRGADKFIALTAGIAEEAPATPPEPHAIQLEALEKLRATRSEGHQAGLVVMGTGLGKTWLAAFDSAGGEFRRVLFVAHREEILEQARTTFRSIRPEATLGLFTGQTKLPDAEVVFASVQTLSRQRHLMGFAREAFDYIIIDEFHHAAAATYRRLIHYFTPAFLLGLTATPERTDGGDLLSLCDDNLVYQCDFLRGIRKGLLCPFHYFGVPDEVDYANIPWRSSRFDEKELTRAVATRRRAHNAFEQLRARGGKSALAFCCSKRHADFMRDYFREQGLRVAAVHSGDSSDPRATSLEMLKDGKLDIVCAVDMFNEGVDLPDVDTVVMLRPTESRILWLQQLGRGLRVGKDKTLKVIDYIGNHRSFLLKPQALFGLPQGDSHVREALANLQRGETELPPGSYARELCLR